MILHYGKIRKIAAISSFVFIVISIEISLGTFNY
jgi:hypothetical protein